MAEKEGSRLLERLARLHPGEQIAGAGALTIFASMILPWYGVPVSGGLVQTGIGTFDWVHAALLLSAAATLYLIGRSAARRPLPEPISHGMLLATAGIWCALLVLYLIADRPDQLAGTQEVSLRYGLIVAIGGAGAIIGGGLTLRESERAG